MSFLHGFLLAAAIFGGIPFLLANWEDWFRALLCWKDGHMWKFTKILNADLEIRECLCCGEIQHGDKKTFEIYRQPFKASYVWPLRDCIGKNRNVY